jgi:hypothetical protein
VAPLPKYPRPAEFEYSGGVTIEIAEMRGASAAVEAQTPETQRWSEAQAGVQLAEAWPTQAPFWQL